MTSLQLAARRLSGLLRERHESLVLAESCTGGLAAASLVGEPGASEVLAGSFVTYQTRSKAAWLGVPAAMLRRHGPVSEEVAAAMAAGAAALSPHAEIAAAITGHLGPEAPAGEDGRLLIAVRISARSPVVTERRLPDSVRGRRQRQEAAAVHFLTTISDALSASAP
ncbi:CinA family protein [Alienimonas chondri]|uniref:CinA-like protein n=1 Tax=Alienimonas chondri TaxID=2681879 RepID=A0ABX1VEH0_9PLAN|nr:nicotinamide-nucleotide amidohydrolase family protein [Alienimonas chondri]NNJ26287.1 CinA-like protein [Alienimonas chondri]